MSSAASVEAIILAAIQPFALVNLGGRPGLGVLKLKSGFSLYQLNVQMTAQGSTPTSSAMWALVLPSHFNVTIRAFFVGEV